MTKQYEEFWIAWGEKQRGMFFVQDKEGNTLVQIGKKIVIASGSYAEPVIGEIREFQNTKHADVFMERVYHATKRR